MRLRVNIIVMSLSQSSHFGHFSRLLENLYAALWSPEGMDAALKTLKDYFECCSATLVCLQNQPRQLIYGWSVGIPENHGRRYIEENMVARDIAIDFFALESPKQQRFVASSELLKELPLVDVVSDEFKPWLRDEAIVDSCGYILEKNGNELHLISFQRNEEAGQFSQEELEQMNLIVPHVKQCMGLFNHFHQQQAKSSTLQAAINSLQLPTFVLNNLLQVVHANPITEQFLQEHKILRVQNTQLVINDDELHHEYIFQACKLVSYRIHGAEEKGHTILTIPCARGEVQLSLSPMFSSPDEGQKKQGLLVQCHFIEKPLELTVERIRQQLCISRAEAEICLLLAQGESIVEISTSRGVSINTVRGQVRSVYKKTPYSRQGELIKALLSL